MGEVRARQIIAETDEETETIGKYDYHDTIRQ
jgi:hypothetical protein